MYSLVTLVTAAGVRVCRNHAMAMLTVVAIVTRVGFRVLMATSRDAVLLEGEGKVYELVIDQHRLDASWWSG